MVSEISEGALIKVLEINTLAFIDLSMLVEGCDDNIRSPIGIGRDIERKGGSNIKIVRASGESHKPKGAVRLNVVHPIGIAGASWIRKRVFLAVQHIHILIVSGEPHKTHYLIMVVWVFSGIKSTFSDALLKGIFP
ncbi:hypothetical protein SDC9_190254 [bioreactor metagenome]|uniref:Uncharacterized protein n=1 Tax=bioreactor metagenome TaxID=1076179 RepID=A0A645HUQ4_9ZZZZ